MKIMKKIRLLGMSILMVLVFAGLSACSKSSDDEKDDEGNNYKSLIIGKWKVAGDYSMIATHVEYKKDGTFSYTTTKEEWSGYEEHGIYKIEDDILYEKFSDENDWSMNKIILLNSISLMYKEIKDNGELSKITYNFQREN